MWNIEFISQEDFDKHVENTINEYTKALNKPMDLDEFNKNTIDPIKFIFDKAVYNMDWDELINREILRQRDKTVTNSIGYFHQKIFQYMHRNGCEIVMPKNGEAVFVECGGQKGWDVVFQNDGRIAIDDNVTVKRVYAEIKNKHNTMNSNSAAATFQKMTGQIGADGDCACFLVEAIAKKSQNVPWAAKGTATNSRIRRVSLDEFYGVITGDSCGFLKICLALPKAIERVLGKNKGLAPLNNTIYDELRKQSGPRSDDPIAMAMYMLGFGTYTGFKK